MNSDRDIPKSGGLKKTILSALVATGIIGVAVGGTIAVTKSFDDNRACTDTCVDETPVCGQDGFWYANSCLASCAGTRISKSVATCAGAPAVTMKPDAHSGESVVSMSLRHSNKGYKFIGIAKDDPMNPDHMQPILEAAVAEERSKAAAATSGVTGVVNSAVKSVYGALGLSTEAAEDSKEAVGGAWIVLDEDGAMYVKPELEGASSTEAASLPLRASFPGSANGCPNGMSGMEYNNGFAEQALANNTSSEHPHSASPALPFRAHVASSSPVPIRAQLNVETPTDGAGSLLDDSEAFGHVPAEEDFHPPHEGDSNHHGEGISTDHLPSVAVDFKESSSSPSPTSANDPETDGGQNRRLAVIGDDSRWRITNGSGAPHKFVGELTPLGCTGTLIGPNHIITAGHCLWARWKGQGTENGRWRTSDWFYSGRTEGQKFNDFSRITRKIVHRSYKDINKYEFDFDYGIAILEKPLGAKLGWMGLGYDCATPKTHATLSVAGYPADKPFHTMWQAQCGNVDMTCGYGSILHECDTFAGMSGSAMFDPTAPVPTGEAPRIVAIHVAGSSDINIATLIQPHVYDAILDWKGNSTNECPAKRV